MSKIYLSIIAISLIISGCSNQKGGRPKGMNFGPANVTVVKAQTKTVIESKKVIGIARASKVVEVRSRIDGFVEKELVKDFQNVTVGQHLYSIESKQILANLKSDEAIIFKTKTDFMNAKANLERHMALFESKAASKAEVELAKGAYAKAKADLMTAEASFDKNNLLLSYSNIKAPISGTIDAHKYEVGSFVNQTNNLLNTIYDTKTMFIDISLSDSDAKLAQGLNFTIADRSVRLESCSPTADINTKLVSCRLHFPNSIGLKNNQNVEVQYASSVKKLLVPQKSVTQYKTGKAVYLITGKDQFKPVNIEVGAWHDSDIEVLSGLKEGDPVIFGGIAQVKADGKIKIDRK